MTVSSSICRSCLSIYSSVRVFIFPLSSGLRSRRSLRGSRAPKRLGFLDLSGGRESAWALQVSRKWSRRARSMRFSTSWYHSWNCPALLVPTWKLLKREVGVWLTASITQLKCYLLRDLRRQKHRRGNYLTCRPKICIPMPSKRTRRSSHLPRTELLTKSSDSLASGARREQVERALSSSQTHLKQRTTCSSRPWLPTSFQQSTKSSPGRRTPFVLLSCLQFLRISCSMKPNSGKSSPCCARPAATSMNLWNRLVITYCTDNKMSKLRLTSFPPLPRLLQRYQSLPRLSQPPLDPAPIPLPKQPRKVYVSRSSSFFLRQASEKFVADRSDQKTEKQSPQQSRKRLCQEQVLQAYKRLHEPRVNPRLQESSQAIFRLSNYDQFQPFSRSHQLLKTIPRTDPGPSPQK